MIAVVFNISLLNGFQAQATRNMVSTDVAGGHYVVPGLDLLSPAEWENLTAEVPQPLQLLGPHEKAEVLIQQGQIFPKNRLFPVQLRGVDMNQDLLHLPLDVLKRQPEQVLDTVPVLLGARMAKRAHLSMGDTVVLKWRDRFGAIDARDAQVVGVAHIANPRIDEGILWLRLDHLRQMTRRPGEISWVTVDRYREPVAGLEFRAVDRLMADLLNLLKHDRRNAKILWTILIFLAAISIFNTQILSVFKRQREIGALLAMGMDAGRVAAAFALEGILAALSATVVAFLLGVPLLAWFQSVGLDVSHLKETTLPIEDNIFLDIRPEEVVLTFVVVVSVMVVVAWIPVRKISRMDPALALRGRALQ
jgi:ABC-type lipoprotein release transport system permease subunit